MTNRRSAKASRRSASGNPLKYCSNFSRTNKADIPQVPCLPTFANSPHLTHSAGTATPAGMKPLIPLLLVGTLCLAGAGSTAVPDSGRFQIFSGTYRAIKGSHVPIILKVDTATGATWEFGEFPSDTGSSGITAYHHVWFQISEPPTDFPAWLTNAPPQQK
jgi:hypothetical protein